MAVNLRIDALLMTQGEIEEIEKAAGDVYNAVLREKGETDLYGFKGGDWNVEQSVCVLYRVEREINKFLTVWNKYTGQIYIRDLEKEALAKIRAKEEEKQND